MGVVVGSLRGGFRTGPDGRGMVLTIQSSRSGSQSRLDEAVAQGEGREYERGGEQPVGTHSGSIGAYEPSLNARNSKAFPLDRSRQTSGTAERGMNGEVTPGIGTRLLASIQRSGGGPYRVGGRGLGRGASDGRS